MVTNTRRTKLRDLPARASGRGAGLYIRYMPPVPLRPPSVSPSTVNLASLLDLSTRLSESDSSERILNAALLSVMGKLKIRRACVLHPDGHRFFATHCKGVTAFTTDRFPIDEALSCLADEPAMQPLLDRGLTWCLPLMVRQDLLAVLCFGDTLDGTDHSPEVRTYLDLVRSITATAVQNATTVQSLLSTTKELERRNLLVTALFESARDFSGLNDMTGILRTLSYRLMGQLMISTFGLYLVRPLDGHHTVINRREAAHLADLRDDLMPLERTVRVEDLPAGASRDRLLDAGIAVVASATVHGTRTGVLALCGKLNGQRFTDEELTFAEALGNTAMAAIENDRLFREELARRTIESELAIAADIQRGLLPLHLPSTPGLSIAADTKPSKHVSGDYYDVIALPDNRTLIAIADVAGKGVPAAILMANVQAALNVLATLGLSPTAIVERINHLVCDNTEPDVFVTLFLAVLDPATRSIHYVNAGHNPPMLLRGDDVLLLSDGGVLTGVIPDPPPYALGVGTFDDTSVLVLYTDGITEAHNGDRTDYGVGNLVECVRAHRDQHPQAIVQAVLDDVRRYSGSDDLVDDSSIVVVKPHDPSSL